MISTVDETGVTSTLAGLWRSLSVSAWISAGMVAEKSKVCFLTGSNEIIFLTSWINPISSIRSASSRTKISTWAKSTKPCPTKSLSRPGVATSMSIPRRSSSIWGFAETPPKMTAHLTEVREPYSLKFSAICRASSLVGVRIRERITLFEYFFSDGFIRFCIMGSANAAVFPVPVWAQPSTSRPASTWGMAFSWIGEGLT